MLFKARKKNAEQAVNEFNQVMKPVSLWDDAWKRLKKNKMALIGLYVVILYIVVSFLAPVLPIYPYEEQYLDHIYLKPSFKPAGEIMIAQKKAYIESCIGTKVKAVVEKYRKGDVRAVTENFLHVRIEQKQGVLRDHSTAGGSEVTVCIQAVCEKGLCGEEYEADAVFCR